jgi:hypothetical protein
MIRPSLEKGRRSDTVQIDYFARMNALERVSARLDCLDPRHALVEGMLRRMLLSQRMTKRLAVARPESPLTHALLCEVELACLQCAARQRCGEWLDGYTADEGHRDFCPNAGLFAVLPRQTEEASACEGAMGGRPLDGHRHSP